MFKSKWFHMWHGVSRMRGLALALLMTAGLWSNAHAGWNAYTNGDAGFNAPISYTNLRTIDFSTGTSTATTNNTLTTEQTASRLTFSSSTASGGAFNQTDTSGATGMSGKHVYMTSGTSGNATSLTVNFANGGTSYVSFDWYLGLKDQNAAYVTFTFSDGSTQTLYSCNTAATSTCLGAYVPSNFLTNLFNALTLCLFGCNQYDTVYLTYVPSTGVKITSVAFYNKVCNGCGFLGFDSSQEMFVDNISYVDPTVGPHHLELTTTSATAIAGANTTFTIKSCADAACSTLFTTGMTGTLALTGSGMTATYPSGQTYSIGARSSSGTLAASITPAGTATVAISAPSMTPSGSPSVYCGMGVAAASGNACTLTVLGLHHLEVTTAATSGVVNTAVTYTIKACADASCSTLYTAGVTGTLTLTGVTVAPASQAFSITAGTSQVTANATPSTNGSMTASTSVVVPTPSVSPYCGMGVAAANGNSCVFTVNQALHHVELTTDGTSKLTCKPTTYTIKACGDASCATTYTLGLTGTLTVSGQTANYPSGQTFTIANGSSSTTLAANITTVGSATAALSALSVTPTNGTPVFCGMGGAAATSGGSCALTTVDTALIFNSNISNHVADAIQTVTISAVQSSAHGTMCTPTFVSTSKNVTFKCGYSNPSSGYVPVLAGAGAGTMYALNSGNNSSSTCDGTGYSVPLSFDASGNASVRVQYADVGYMSLSATYTGSGSDAGLSMTSGSTYFTAVPSSFVISGTPALATKTKAGNSFSATITAKNSTGTTTKNFGRETVPITDYVRLSWTKYQPTGVGAVAGTFTGTGSSGTPTLSSSSFSNGAVTVSNLSWSEVGTGDLTASLVGSTYLGVGSTTVTGTTGSTGATIGPFIPDHFDVSGFTKGCGAAFTYSGQPFAMTLTAKNLAGVKTQNYDGTTNTTPNFAQAVTLSDGGGTSVGTFSAVAATSFNAGVAALTPTYTFTNKPTVPTTLTVRATDADNVVSSPGTEGSTSVRIGRIKMSNFFGAATTSQAIPVQVQYWNSNKTWVINSSDSCTTSIPASAVVLTNYLDAKGASTTAWTTTPSAVSIAAGNGTLTLSAPSPSGTGSVDVALNLGSSSTDQSCLSTHPATTGAGLSWLRAQNGSTNGCSGITTYDRDPSARATFGVYSSESKKAVFTRDMY